MRSLKINSKISGGSKKSSKFQSSSRKNRSSSNTSNDFQNTLNCTVTLKMGVIDRILKQVELGNNLISAEDIKSIKVNNLSSMLKRPSISTPAFKKTTSTEE
jgi:hypothetical protein